MSSVSVLVVDDHPIVRRGLRTLLETETWVSAVHEAATAAEALRAAVESQVDVVVMDVSLPDGDGVEVTSRILRARPSARVLMLSMNGDDPLVARSLRAGARGYLIKETDPTVVVDALRTVAGDGVVLGPGIGHALLDGLRARTRSLPAPFDTLTPREHDILAGLAGGDSNVRIARRLGVSEKTIRNQMSALFVKIGARDRFQAALLARDAGIPTPTT
ncbi:response regulator transcription factor [Micromonospora sp. CPCC 205371]|nr:response regulator transcription factor [Micromonospora sp. CPCC 205371]